MNKKKRTYKRFGEKALLIEWPARIDERTVKEISNLKRKLGIHFNGGYSDMIIGYHSLTLVFFSPIEELNVLIETIEAIADDPMELTEHTYYTWRIPVCYESQFGIDIEEIALEKKLSIQEFISLHSSRPYPIYFIGFLPGFLYLGGLDDALHMPRKSTPRLSVPKGAVAIGGEQTGIYPTESAGGWNIIGRTPLSFFDVHAEKPCFAKPGDAIQFFSISLEQYMEIELEVSLGNYQIPKQVRDD